ncbi:MAG: ABC transporter permease, partial [Pseudoflavonifractor sp.]
MADERKLKRPFSTQPDEDIISWNTLTPADFAPASSEEKASFMADRKSVSYWADAWRRLKKNTVAMVAMVVIIAIFIFAFIGPIFMPYQYDGFNAGGENLHPWHYSLEDQKALADALTVQDPDEAVAEATAKAEAAGKTLSPIQVAKIRAQVVSSLDIKDASGKKLEGPALEKYMVEKLGLKTKFGGYSVRELEAKAAGEKVFPHVFGTDMFGRDIMVRVMVGTRVSMIVGVCAALLVLLIGALYGSISGYCGGIVDTIMQRIVEMIYSIPEVLVILLISTVLSISLGTYMQENPGTLLTNFTVLLGPNLIAMFIAFGLLYWVTMSRIIRGQIIQL